LWVRLLDRRDFPLPLDDHTKPFLWQAVACHPEIEFYQLPEPRPDVETFDRFSTMTPDQCSFLHPVSEDLFIMD
jgi:general transcription factor 3C polypeptide 1